MEQQFGIIERLKEEGLLLRNSGTNSLKSLKDVNSKSNEILQCVCDKLDVVAESIKQSNKLKEEQIAQEKDQHDENVDREKEKKEDEKRKKKDDSGPKNGLDGLIKAMREQFDGLRKSFSSTMTKFKEGMKDSGNLLKKILGIGAIAFVLKDVIDQWTGGAATQFINDITGENGLFSQIKAAGLAIAGLGLLLAPGTTIRLGFKALGSLLSKDGLLRSGLRGLAGSLGEGGLLRRGLSGFSRLFSSSGPLMTRLGGFRDMFSRGRGSLMSGLSGLRGRLSGLKNVIGTRGGRAGLVAALVGATAAIAEGAASVRGATRTPAPDGTRPTAPQVSTDAPARPRTPPPMVTDGGTARTIPADDVLTRPRATPAPSVVTPDQAPRVVPTPPTPSAATGARVVAGAADDAATPLRALSQADRLKMVARAVGRNGLKAIPIVGAGLGAIFTAMRAWEGDWAGAGAEAGLIFAPGPVGIPGDIALAVRDAYADMYKAQYGVWPWNDTDENREVRGPIVMQEAENAVRSFVSAQEAGQYAPDQLQIEERSGWWRRNPYIVTDSATGDDVRAFRTAEEAQAFIQEHTMGGESAAPAPVASGGPRLDAAGGEAAISAAREAYQSAGAEIADIDSQIAALGPQVKIGERDDPFGDTEDIMGFADAGKQAQLEKLTAQKRSAQRTQRSAGRDYAKARDNVDKTYEYGETDGLDDYDRFVDDADKIQALKNRGFSDEELGRNDNLSSNFIEVDGARYPLRALGKYEQVLKSELEGSGTSMVKEGQSSAGVKYDRATSDQAVAATSPANDMKNVIAPVIQNSTSPKISKGGDTITNNYFLSKSSGIDPAAPMMGR